MDYGWISLSLVSAFSLATSDALTKRALVSSNEYLVAWFRLLFSAPLLLLLYMVIPKPVIGPEFKSAFLVSLPLEIAAMLLYVRALRISPLSLTLPFLSLTPVFLIAVSFLVAGEEVSVAGALGICCIAAGGFVLNLHEMRTGLLGPLKAIIREKGSLFMIMVAFIYSFTSSLGKVAIVNSSALYFGITYFIVLTVLFMPFAFWMGRHEIKDFIKSGSYKKLLIPGICYSLMIASHMTAISLTKVAYMISLKRTSVIMGMLYGYFLFGEAKIRQRLLGGAMMIAGFAIIVTTS